jgi:predicted PurR-regulated permease PerM
VTQESGGAGVLPAAAARLRSFMTWVRERGELLAASQQGSSGAPTAPEAAGGPGGAAGGGPGPDQPGQGGPGEPGQGQLETDEPAGPAQAVQPDGGRPAPDQQVPRLLRQAAAWAWRLILVAILIYGAFRVAVALRLVVLPLIAALLLTALLQPLAARLRRAGLPALLATWGSLLVAIILIAGAVTLTANRVSADYPTLAAEVRRTAGELQTSLAGPPFHLHGARLQQLTNQLVQFLSQHKSMIAGTVVTGGRIFIETLTGLILTLFISFFLLKDGAKIWSWLISGLSPRANRKMDSAGHAAWHVLTNYVRGTTLVAAIHAIFIGLALWLLGVPLLVPLVILVFLAAFVPLIGILVVGALAILVTLATKGWIAAVILLAVFLLENQIEGHLLQPLVVGRAVKLHPLAIILALAVGGVIAGIPGAIVAVPAAAVITYAWPYLRESEAVSPPER